MAIYHLQCKISSRKKGRNAISSAAYRRGIELRDIKTNQLYNYKNKEEVVHSEFVIPENSPAWLQKYSDDIKIDEKKEMEDYWNYVEFCEKRKDASLTRDFIIALPKELTTEQHIKLAHEFVVDQLAKRGMVADFSIHMDKGNPHLHIATSMRAIQANGFGNKVREWNDKSFLKNIRMSWSEYANFHLKLAGHDVRIDHRSYADMGIDLIPSFHIGRAAYDLERRGHESDLINQAEEIRVENLRRIKGNPTIVYDKMMIERESFTASDVIDEISRYTRTTVPDFNETSRAKVLSEAKITKILGDIEHHESVFTNRDIIKVLTKNSVNIDDAKVFSEALIELKGSKELIYLGAGDDGQDRYTTRKMFRLENGIQNSVDQMREVRHVKINPANVAKYIQEYQSVTGKILHSDQLAAVQYILDNRQIACVVGRAGTGKSFSLGAANSVWQKAGFKVYGVALSGVAADGLDKDAGMKATTIESFKYQIKAERIVLNRKSVVVMDEAGMTDSLSMAFVIDAVKQAGAKLVMVGDHAQLQPVGPGAAFRAIVERMTYANIRELTTVQRQKGWQADATTDFAKGNVAAAIDAYDQNGSIQYHRSKDATLTALTKEWGKAYNVGTDLKQMMVLAYTRDDVKVLNEKIRGVLAAAGVFKDSHEVNTSRGTIQLATGDRILFLKNSKKFGVKNGRFAIVDSIEMRGKVKFIHATLDGAGKKVVINTADYQHFDYGYAATVHKTQGATVDKSFLFIAKGWDRCLAYVGMTRHRESCQVFTDLKDKAALIHETKKYAIKDSLFDFAYHFAMRRGFEEDSLGERLKTHLSERISVLKAKITGRYNELNAHHWDTVGRNVENNPEFKATFESREKARLVAAYANTNREAGIVYEQLNLKMSELGLKTADHKDPRTAVLKQTEAYKNFVAYLVHRDKLAHKIAADLPTYSKAIEVSNIDLDKLQAQAQKHEYRGIVKEYAENFTAGRAILRDKLAMQVTLNIKGFYPLLKEAGVDTSELYNQARTHERRLFSKNLNVEDRSRLREVERYLALEKETVRIYVKHNPFDKQAAQAGLKKIGNYAFTNDSHYQKVAKERDGLAFKIFNNIKDYNQALDFYEIGLARPQFGSLEKPNEIAIRKATQRWYKLEQQAVGQQIRILLHAYIDAKKANNSELCMQLAAQMLQDKKSAFREFAREYGPKNTLWFDIHKDAKAFVHYNFYKGLTDEQSRALFKEVKTFIEARNEARRSWLDALQGLPSPFDFSKLNDIFSHTAQALSQRKSTLARELIKSFKEGHAVYEHFELSFEMLKNEAGFKKVDEQAIKVISQYQKLCVEGKEYVERSKLSRVLVENKDTLKGPITALGIDWRVLYQDATNGYRHYLVNDLLPNDKAEVRAAWQYQAANREVGIAWGKVSDYKKQNKQVPPALYAKAERASAKRDALAYNLIESGNITTGFVFKNKDQQLRAQAAKHQEKIELTRLYTKERTHYLESLKRIIQSGKPSVDFIFVQDELAELMKPFEKRLTAHEYALRANGITKEQIQKDQELFKVYKQFAYRAEKITMEVGQGVDTDAQAKIKRAQNILKQTVAIEGTLAERYLREQRGIQSALPASCRYHPGIRHFETGDFYPALVVAAKNIDRAIGSPTLQVIYLDKDTGNKAALEAAKLTYGRYIEGSAVLINKGRGDGRVFVVEGPETALSIKDANPDATIYAVLGSGNFKKIPLSAKIKEIIICADNDYKVGQSKDEMPASEKKVHDAAEYFANKGIDVYKVMPENAKEDFNDVLKKQGVEKIREHLAHPEKIAEGVTLERLESQIKKHLPKETIRYEDGKVILTTELVAELKDYMNSQAIYDAATMKYFSNISNPNKKEFRIAMDAASAELKGKVATLTQNPDYQEMIKHKKYELILSQNKTELMVEIKESIHTGAMTEQQIYRLSSKIDTTANTLGLNQSATLGKGRSV